jgi:hypothetical protein
MYLIGLNRGCGTTGFVCNRGGDGPAYTNYYQQNGWGVLPLHGHLCGMDGEGYSTGDHWEYKDVTL